MKRLSAVLLVLISLASNILTVNASSDGGVKWPKGPKVNAKAAIVMEASTGLILYEKNIHEKNYPASTTKLVTTLLALENSSLHDVVTFSRDSVFNIERGSSHIGIDVGEKLTMENCLYGIMLASANEVSYAVAEHVAGSMSAFSKMMNERVKELGGSSTHFINPHGLYDEEHYTSAYDLALVSRELLKYDSFRKINGTINYVVPPTNLQKEARPIYNHHKMIRNTSYHYDGAIGGKTGYTVKARYNLATFASRDNMELICIIMNEDNMQDQYSDTKKLLDFGFSNYTSHAISGKNAFESTDLSLFSQFNPLFGQDSSPLAISNKGRIILPKSVDTEEAVRTVHYMDDVSLGDGMNTIGNVTYEYGGKNVGYADILYNKAETATLEKASVIIDEGITIKERIEENKQVYWFVIAAVLLAIGILYYILIERPRRRRRKNYYSKRKRTRDTFGEDFIDI